MNQFEIQNSITFVEDVNLDYFDTIINNYDMIYESLGRFKDHKNGFKTITDKATIRTLIEKRLKHGNSFTYKSDGGRLIPTGGISSYSCCMMNKVLRHTIAGKNNIDLDIVNAHPNGLSWYCHIRNWPCHNLDNYINNREDFLKKVIDYYGDDENGCLDRDGAKIKILSLINDNNNKFNSENPLFDFHNEIKILQDLISKERKDLYLKAKRKSPENAKGRCMSLFLQEMENKICQCMIQYCQKNNIYITAPCFDGLLISRCDDVDKLITSLQDYVFETLDIKITLSEKKMNSGISVLLDNLDNKSVKSDRTDKTDKNKIYDIFDISMIQDEQCGIFVLNKLKKDKTLYFHKKNCELFIFNEDKVLYEEHDIDYIITFISSTCKEYFEILGLYDTTKEYSPSVAKAISSRKVDIYKTTFQRSVLTQIKVRLPDDSDFIDKYFDKIPHLIPLKDNKILDTRFDMIRDRTKEDFFTITTNLSYDKDVDVSITRNFLKNYLIKDGKVIDDDDEIHIDSFLFCMAYCILGYNHLKKIFIMIGVKNTGKSTILNDKMFSLFGDFYSTVDKKVVCDTNTNSVHNQEFFTMLRRRFISCGELTEHDKFNVSLMKTITGDDKKVPLRRCGGNKNYDGIIDCKVVLPLNSMIKTGDDALMKRVIAFNFPNVFTPKTISSEELFYVKEGINNNFVSTIFKYCHLFERNNREIQWSNQIKLSTTNVLTECDDILQFVTNNFTLTDDYSDRIPKQDVFNMFRDLYSASIYTKHKNKFYKKFESYLDGRRIYRDRDYSGIKYKGFDFDTDITEDL
jgi:phage/plasmid-associated DNA primase